MTTQITSFEEYQRVYQESVNDPEAFWAAQAETFTWRKKWARDWNNVLYCSQRCKMAQKGCP